MGKRCAPPYCCAVFLHALTHPERMDEAPECYKPPRRCWNKHCCCVQVGFETEGTAIYDTMQFVKNEVSAEHKGRVLVLHRLSCFLVNKPLLRLLLSDEGLRVVAGSHRGCRSGNGPGMHAAVGRPQGEAFYAASCNRLVFLFTFPVG